MRFIIYYYYYFCCELNTYKYTTKFFKFIVVSDHNFNHKRISMTKERLEDHFDSLVLSFLHFMIENMVSAHKIF